MAHLSQRYQRLIRSVSRDGVGTALFLAIFLALGQAQNEPAPPPREPAQDTINLATQAPDSKVPNAGSVSNFDLGLNLGVPSPAPPPSTPSFLVANMLLGESTEWFPAGSYSSLRISGNVELLKFWRRSVTALDYVGGASFYPSQENQHLTAAHAFLWRGRQLTISDSLSNSNAGGSFGASVFGGGGLYGLIFAGTDAASPGGLSLFSGGSSFGGSGSQISNVTQGTLSQDLTGRSTLSLLAGYGVATYFGSSGENLNNSRQLSVAAQYRYDLSPRSAFGILYGYRNFRFPLNTQGSLRSNIVQLSYQRVVSRRMTASVGAGPDFDSVTREVVIPPLLLTLTTHQIGLSAHGSLDYRLKMSTLRLSYQRVTTNGSGLFAGANTDALQGSVNRRIFREWSANIDTGYVRLKQIQQPTTALSASYQYWYAGVGVRRSIGENFSFVASYQFTDETSKNSPCEGSPNCAGGRSIVLVGISWHPRSVRLDHGSEQAQPDNTDPTVDDPYMNCMPLPRSGTSND